MYLDTLPGKGGYGKSKENREKELGDGSFRMCQVALHSINLSSELSNSLCRMLSTPDLQYLTVGV